MQTTLPVRPSHAGLFALSCTEAMWLAILLALPLVMNVSVARSFEASKLLAVAPMAALGVGALLAAALERALNPMRALLTSVPVLAFCAFTASAVLATLSSETPWIAFFGDYFRREGLIFWLICAMLFAGLTLCLRRHEQMDRLIDVLLLATLPPCIYAVMQRYGFDFFLTEGLAVGTSAARPGGTMGNPTFLGSMLLLVIPVTLARAIAAGPGWKQRPLWLAIFALQVFASMLTQSRGPLIGLAIALFVFLLLVGARARARGLVLAAFGAVLAGALGLALINFVPALAQSVKGTPLQRFVFTGSDLTSDSRVGIWRAGVDSFTHAPWWRQLIGYGPDAASFNYFNWMPAYVQRIEGYTETIDRLHSDFLETLLSFGLLGLLAQVTLFSALVWMAAQRLLPLPGAAGGRKGWPGYALWVAIGAIAGALLAYIGGASLGVLPIGASAGLAGAWVLFLAWRAWRHVRSADIGESGATREEALLITAMVSALIGSWIETQVGVPTIATRALVAVFAALIPLTVHAAWRRQAAAALQPAAQPAPVAAPAANRKSRKKQAAAATAVTATAPVAVPWYPVLGWAACMAVIITTADFYPPLSGTRMLAPSMLRLPLIIWPQALTVLAAFFIARSETARNGGSRLQALTRFLLWSVPGPLVFAIVYAKLAGAVDNAPDEVLRERIAALVTFCFATYMVLAALLAAALYCGSRGEANGGRRSGPGGIAALAAGAAFCVATFLGARIDLGADVGAKLAAWAQNQRRFDAAAAFLKDSVRMMPQERRFAGSYAARLIEATAADAGRVAGQPSVATEMVARLAEAERTLAHAHELAPRDPWITFSYANVNQFMGLGLLAGAVPAAERARYAGEARKYMALAHQQFPGHPWILRNWAQLEFDQGNHGLAYAKLEEMEKLDPRNPTAYTEWLKLTRMDNNPGLALGAVRRGLSVMPPGSDDAALLLQMLIDIPRDAGNMRGALSAALEYTATQPDRIGAWRQLAELYAINRQPDLALSNAQAVLARFANVRLSPQGQKDYAALQDLAQRLTYGNGSAAAPAAGARAPAR